MSHFKGETSADRYSTEQQNMAPDCGSHSNTESDRDANNDDVSSKPAEAEGSSDEEPPAGEDLSEEVYEVEKILDHDETPDGLFYLVHWKGFGEEDDSWEPAENLAFATKAINEYETRRKSKSKKGKKSASKTPKSKSKQKGHEKESKKSSSSKEQHEKSTPASNSKKRGRAPKSSVSDKSESEPEIPSDDEDDEYVDKQKSTKKSTPTAKYSGTVTKAALKSYSPTTTKASRNSSLSAQMPPVETISAAKKALQMRQSWLYDSDSDDDSGTEKENEKKMEQNKKSEAEMESLAKAEEEKHKKQVEEAKKLEEVHRPNDRKRKGDESSAEKKKKAKSETISDNHHEIPKTLLQGMSSSTSSDQVENGSSAVASTSNVRLQDQSEIFAIAKDRDGRIRVLIGVDGVKKVVSLRDAHDANSWGLVQHILKFASFADFE